MDRRSQEGVGLSLGVAGGEFDDGGPDPWLGTQLGGRYHIESLLGEGTAGVVYRARHLEMDKPVAVKLLHGAALGSRRVEMEKRFSLEARVYGQITSPHVCAATDFGVTEDGTRYLVMELLEGQTLAALMATEGALEPARAVGIAMQICEGLVAVHESGVVHRDLKPENIFIVTHKDDENWVKLVDFGIAKSMDADDASRLTSAGEIYGTPAYLAPEQTHSMDIDGRADLYALGVVLFEMLAGRLPFESNSPIGYMQMHAFRMPPSLNELVDGLAPGLPRLVDRLLDKEPESRPPDAETVRGLLALSLDSVVLLTADEAAAVERTSERRANQRATGSYDVSMLPVQPRTGISWRWFVLAVAVVAIGATAFGITLTGADVVEVGKSIVTGSKPDVAAASKPAVSRSSGPMIIDLNIAEGSEPRPSVDSFIAARKAFVGRDDVRTALVQRQSNPQLTLNAMRRLVATEAKNAHAYYYLGMTQHDMGRNLDAAESWHRALELEPRYGADQELAQRLLDEYALPEQKAREAAERAIIKGRVLRSGTKAVSKLIRAGMDADLVARVHTLAVNSHILSEIPGADQHLLVLRAISGCESRTAALAKLAELGDRGVLPVLTRLQASNRGCGSNGNDDCMACIRPLLERVIRQLKP